LSIDVVALTSAAARAKVEASGSEPDWRVRVIDVEEVRAIVDWSKPWLSMEEMAVRYGKEYRTISRWVELGLLPRCEGGYPMWNVETADRAAAKSVGLKFESSGSRELKAA
jgi:hypothetical protein